MIILDDIHKSFRKHTILKPTGFVKIEPGVNILMGLNGTGKTTLMKMLIGIITPDGGEISYDGASIREVIHKIGVMFDQPLIYAHLSGEENLNYFNYIREKPTTKENVVQLASKWGIPLDRRPVSKYSLGMRKRLSIAISLLTDPEYWYLDEPFNGLDFSSAEQLIDQIEQYRNEGKTVILITHDINLNLQLADQLIILHKGRICYVRDPEESLKDIMEVQMTIRLEELPEYITSQGVRIQKLNQGMRISIPKRKEKEFLNKLILNDIIPEGIELNIPSIDELVSELDRRDNLC